MKKILLLTLLIGACATPKYEVFQTDYKYVQYKVIVNNTPYFVFRDGSAKKVDLELWNRTAEQSIVKLEWKRKK